MSWLSKLTGGIFLPLCCCTGWGSTEEGASRHAFTEASRFSAQWQNLALGLRFHCVLVGVERLSMSQSEGRVHVRSLVCPGSTSSDIIPLSKRLSWISPRQKGMWSEDRKNLHVCYQQPVVSGGPVRHVGENHRQLNTKHTVGDWIIVWTGVRKEMMFTDV